MSLFGYPAEVIHQQSLVDNWGRVASYTPQIKAAKVIEEQKEIKNGNGEEIKSIAEIHLEGPQQIGTHDYFEYINAFGQKIRYDVQHIEIKKHLATDDVKKVIVYG